MKLHYIFILLLILTGCAGSNELPTAGTMDTGVEVRTPRQYEEFCERDTHDLCPEEEDNGSDINR